MHCLNSGAANPSHASFCLGCGRQLGPGDPLDFAPTEPALAPGATLLNRYHIVRLLGVGGMGRVYLAEDRELATRVALKVLREVLSEDPASVKRLKEEARLAMALTHEHIVRVNHFEASGPVKFLVMEYVEGETLAHRIAREKRLFEAEARRIGIALCDALAHAHAKGVLHGDVKPSNVLLGSDGSVKLADFGVARAARDSLTHLTGQQETWGTLLYMAPEAVQGQPVDARSDLYSLGATLYETLAGTPPFDTGDVTHQIVHRAPARLSELSADLEAVVLKLLAKQPKERNSVAADVVPLLAGHGASAANGDRRSPPAAASAHLQACLSPPANAKPGDRWTSLIDGCEMIYVSPGEFLMGTGPSSFWRSLFGLGTYHAWQPVRITCGFWLDVTPVTNAAWERFVKANLEWLKSRRVQAGYLKQWLDDWCPRDKADHPVVYVSWHDVRAYCVWARKRLPTEAECEYAARAGSQTAYWWGNEFDASRAHDDQGLTAPVGDQLRTSPWGLADMLGNVWEWNSTRYAPYPYRADDGREDSSGEGLRSVRGGGLVLRPEMPAGVEPG